MKKIIVFLFVGILALGMFASCDPEAPSSPQVRFHNLTTNDSFYVAVGTDLGNNNADLVSSWLGATVGNYSEYDTIPSGEYLIFFDGDSDHSAFGLANSTLWVFEQNMSYEIYFTDTVYNVVEE